MERAGAVVVFRDHIEEYIYMVEYFTQVQTLLERHSICRCLWYHIALESLQTVMPAYFDSFTPGTPHEELIRRLNDGLYFVTPEWN